MDTKVLIFGGIGVLVIAALVIGVTLMFSYNGMVTADQECKAQWGNVESVYQRRFDLIPRLVNLTKSYTNYEGQILQNITALRSQWANAKTEDEKMAAGGELDSALGRLIMVTENYPNLKANEQYMKTMDELAGSENRINVERQRYNDVVRKYNVLITRFPDSMLAGWAGFKERKYFEAKQGADEAPAIPI